MGSVVVRRSLRALGSEFKVLVFKNKPQNFSVTTIAGSNTGDLDSTHGTSSQFDSSGWLSDPRR
jgi:hypothetical protein